MRAMAKDTKKTTVTATPAAAMKTSANGRCVVAAVTDAVKTSTRNIAIPAREKVTFIAAAG
jgi:hypothetical protein